MKPYKIISDYHVASVSVDHLRNKQFREKIAEISTSVLENTQGWKIMNKPVAAQNAATVFQRLVTWTRANCTWDGARRGGSGYKLLEENERTGECSLFAGALLALFTAPAPFGLGLEATRENWNGRYGKGFVVRQAAPVMNLGSNVTGQNLRFWSNHKVVRCNGQLWDAAYGNANVNSATSILFHVMPNEVKDGLVTWYPAEATQIAAGSPLRINGQPLNLTSGVFFREQGGIYTGPHPAIT